MKKLLTICTLSILALTAFAQKEPQTYNPIDGELQVKGGMGNINPFDAKLQLTLRGQKFFLKPYIGVGVVSKEGSGQLVDHTLFYSGTADRYNSSLQTSSKGNSYNYGVSGSYAFNSLAYLSFAVDGTYSALHGYGHNLEMMDNMVSSFGARPFETDIDQPTSTATTIKANLAYNRRLKDMVSSFNIKGNLSREASDQETSIQALSGAGLLPFSQSYLHQNNITTAASVGAEYQRLLEGTQSLTFGAHYDHRHIESDNLQLLDKQKYTSELFEHDMNVVGLYGEYKLSNEVVNLNARLEYTYTDMNGKALHDVIPQLTAIWHMPKQQDLQFVYGMRVVRPDVSYLNPAKIYGAYTIDYGTPDLEGIHINNFALSHILKNKTVRFSTTVSHLRAEDGFNAIWMVKDGMRVSFWGNEGIRRVWSVTPDLSWSPAAGTTIDAKIALAWDKRIAEAINMAKEHWGITTHLGLKQQLPQGFRLNLHADYSEGNTIDLYSHSGKMVSYGGELQRSFLQKKNLMLTLAYLNTDYAKTILTQGAYTGSIYTRPKHHYNLSLALNWKF